jgi:hypothetical protein
MTTSKLVSVTCSEIDPKHRSSAAQWLKTGIMMLNKGTAVASAWCVTIDDYTETAILHGESLQVNANDPCCPFLHGIEHKVHELDDP